MEPGLLDRAGRYDLDIKQIQSRLQAANVWPLRYSDILPTLSLLVICMVSILFYRIGIYVVLAWIASWVILSSAAGIVKKKG